MSTRFYLVLIVLLAPVLTAQDCDRGGKCERRAAFRVNFCFEALADLTRDCYLNTGQPCDPADFDGPLTYVRDVEGACEGSTPQVVGYGAQVHGPDLANRLEEECTGQVASLVARTFGGPHASVLNDAIAGGNTADQACLVAAFDEGAALTASVFDARRLCAQSPELNDVPCDLATTQIDIALAESAAVALIDAGCAGSDLESLIGIDSQEFASRAVTQADCMTSAGIGDTWPLPTTTCGPATIGPNIPIPARATPTQIVLDESVWGTRCGDGSPYAFWIDLAPAGSPVENVVVHMKGGGVCLFNDDCLNKLVNSPDLFSAVDDGFPSGGIFNTDPAVNPFANWTKVSLPYCTQDVFAGMGETEVFPSITVHRYGAVNVRAALQYVRNIIWAEANATSPEGYRPDLMTVLFGGTSAGGFGTLYNLHYPIDDLRWAHTTGVPDAGLGLDNGMADGVIGLGTAKFPVWRVQAGVPPYCNDPSCAAGPIISAAHAVRLGAVPDQQLLLVSNQVDNTQANTTNFPSTEAWTNALRASYCSEAGQNGVYYFLDAQPQHRHGALTDASFSSFEVGGVVLKDWLGGAIADPGSLIDRVEEGTLVTAFPGVLPFACPVDP